MFNIQFLGMLLAFSLHAQAQAKETCTIVKDLNYYLSLSVSNFLAESTGGKRIGGCYIVPRAAFGACDMYAKSAVRGRDGDLGWPKTISKRGTGCVRAPNLPKRVTTCFYKSSSYRLPPDLVNRFCTDDGNSNAVSMIKHALQNGACNLPEPSAVSCVKGSSPKCICIEEPDGPECPMKGLPVQFPTRVFVQRVHRCTSRFLLCRSRLVDNDYRFFGQNRISNRRQRNIYLSQVYKPSLSKTKNVVLVVAGQQCFPCLGSSAQSSGITGQDSRYRMSRRTGGSYRRISSSSLVNAIMRTGYFGKDETFAGLVFDARFHYEFSSSTRQKFFNAYYQYLRSKIGTSTQTVYLGGHSRGGCLVMRLAARLSTDLPNLRIIVHNYDGVCVKSALFTSSEFGVRNFPRRVNPLNNRFFLYTTNMESRFVNRNCLAIRSFLSGGSSAEIGIRIADQFRAFGHVGFTSSKAVLEELKTQSGFPWYTESMYDLSHNSIDGDLHGIAVLHLRKAMSGLPCSCGAASVVPTTTRPPTGTTTFPPRPTGPGFL